MSATPVYTRRTWLGTAAATALAGAAPAWAQGSYPDKPITLIVPFGPGGIADLTARAVTQAMSATLKQSIVVDNRPSAGAIVGSAAVAKAAPDGYTLLLMSNANAVSPGLFKKLPFDVQRDFVPVVTLATFDLAVFVPQGSRFKSLRDMLAYARANPGKLTIGTIAVGSTQHLSAELFKAAAGIDALTVPYKTSSAVLTGLRGGDVDVSFEILGPWMSQLDSKVLRALAVTADDRHPSLKDVPTVEESGVKPYDVASWNALAAPAGTPADVLRAINRAANEALRQPAVLKQLQALGVRPKGGTPEQLATLLDGELKRWGAAVKAAKIEPE